MEASGEVDTVEKIQRADLEEFYRKHYGANGAVVAIMGDVTRSQAEAIAFETDLAIAAGRRICQSSTRYHADTAQRATHRTSGNAKPYSDWCSGDGAG
ncbi:MAG: insulinase family protein [Nitrosomonadales bacterium]